MIRDGNTLTDGLVVLNFTPGKRASETASTLKGAGEFTFGSQEDFVGGLQGLIGLGLGCHCAQSERTRSL